MFQAFAFATQQKDTAFFDQLSGKDLKAFFKEGRLDKVDVSGNVRTIFYPQERDSTFTGLNYAESSFLTMYLKDQKMDKLIMYNKVDGSLTPIPKITPGTTLFCQIFIGMKRSVRETLQIYSGR